MAIEEDRAAAPGPPPGQESRVHVLVCPTPCHPHGIIAGSCAPPETHSKAR